MASDSSGKSLSMFLRGFLPLSRVVNDNIEGAVEDDENLNDVEVENSDDEIVAPTQPLAPTQPAATTTTPAVESTNDPTNVQGEMVVEQAAANDAQEAVMAAEAIIEVEVGGSTNNDDDDTDDNGEFIDPAPRQLTNMSTSRQTAFECGYDSDGEAPPKNNTPSEESQFPSELPLGESPPTETTSNKENQNEPQVVDDSPPNAPVSIAEEVLNKMKVEDIKLELKIRNVTFPSRFKRSELLDRLRQSLHLPVVVARSQLLKKKPNSTKDKKPKVDDMSEFAPGAYWQVLEPMETVVEEPANPSFANARAPTVPESDANKQGAPKHDFSIRFHRPTFTGKTKVADLNADGTPKMDSDGNVLKKEVPRVKGTPKEDFLQRHKLDSNSHPAEFMDAFLPLKMNRYRQKNQQPHISISDMQQWSNMKAMLSNAGSTETYSDFKPFTVKEFQQHLGLYILNGLSPSPSIDMKFDVEDEANFNQFVYSNIDNGVRRHRHFRAFLSCQDPRKEVPNRDRSPLFKVLPLINWLNAIGKASWDLSINLSIDEQTVSFQGRHIDKLRITYKAAGDGFQCDALCDRGFTHSIYFRNEKPPKKYTKMGLSPLHARVMWLFDRIEEEYARVWMDNLYITAKFAKFGYNHPKKVLIAGVARKFGRGVALSVIQEEVKDGPALTRVRGTVKAAVLKGDPDIPNLVACSVYDTKPVHFISTICESIQWILKTRKVWNEQKQKMDQLRFLRLNINDDYNKDMNAVDISDQLRNNYRFDHWLRNFKWWWAIMLFLIGNLCVNSYVVYTSVMESAGIPKKNRLTHYQYRLAIARVWISKDGLGIIRRWKQRHQSATTPTTPQMSGNKRDRETVTPIGSVSSYGSSSSSLPESEPRKKAPRITDDALTPTGRLSGRLDYTCGRKHLPKTREAAGKTFNTKCSLHRWAIGRECEFRKGIFVCNDCGVPLCLDCYAVFHTESDLLSQKEPLRKKMLEAEEQPSPKPTSKTPSKKTPAKSSPKKNQSTPSAPKKKPPKQPPKQPPKNQQQQKTPRKQPPKKQLAAPKRQGAPSTRRTSSRKK